MKTMRTMKNELERLVADNIDMKEAIRNHNELTELRNEIANNEAKVSYVGADGFKVDVTDSLKIRGDVIIKRLDNYDNYCSYLKEELVKNEEQIIKLQNEINNSITNKIMTFAYSILNRRVVTSNVGTIRPI